MNDADGTSNNYNHAIGYRALRYATGGSSNALGTRALQDMTSGYGNNSLGYEAGDDITTGIYNQCIGSQAGSVVTTGQSNQLMGRLANPSGSDGSYQVVIGQSLTGKGDNTAFIGGSSGAYNEANNSTWTTTSDERIKKNIVDNNIGLNEINQIRVRNFEYRTPEEIDPALPSHSAIRKKGTQLGVIAQEIQEILPDVVEEMSTGCLSVNPDNLTWYLVNAVKELSAKNTSLETRVATLEAA